MPRPRLTNEAPGKSESILRGNVVDENDAFAKRKATVRLGVGRVNCKKGETSWPHPLVGAVFAV